MKQREQLPQYVQHKHGAFYYVRWNPTNKKVTWTHLGKTYPMMLRALSGHLTTKAIFMRDIINRYETEILSTKAYNTQKTHRWQLANLLYTFGDELPIKITSQEVYSYHDDRTQHGAPTAANKEVSLLANIFKFAIKWGCVPSGFNPASRLIKNKENPRKRYITDSEYDLLLKHTSGYVHNAIELAYLTGQRIGDVLKMKWADMTPNGIKVIQQKTKKELTVKLSPALSAVITRCKSNAVLGQTVIADSRGQALPYWRVREPFKNLVDKLVGSGKIPETITLHDLRRKAASDTPLESELLGNTRQTRERVYRAKPIVAEPVR